MGKASKSSRKASKAQKANKDEQNEDDHVVREECFLCQQPSDGKTCSDCGIAQVGSSYIQGDHSGFVKPPVDIKPKVTYFCFDVNGRFGST